MRERDSLKFDVLDLTFITNKHGKQVMGKESRVKDLKYFQIFTFSHNCFRINYYTKGDNQWNQNS
jgi:hypothetical protein